MDIDQLAALDREEFYRQFWEGVRGKQILPDDIPRYLQAWNRLHPAPERLDQLVAAIIQVFNPPYETISDLYWACRRDVPASVYADADGSAHCRK